MDGVRTGPKWPPSNGLSDQRSIQHRQGSGSRRRSGAVAGATAGVDSRTELLVDEVRKRLAAGPRRHLIVSELRRLRARVWVGSIAL